jgi:AraC-like DNA-binding protein
LRDKCNSFIHYFYLTEYRIGKSAELLISSSLNVTEIAEQCGFGGASYFTETFRKIMGCTPTEYRSKR